MNCSGFLSGLRSGPCPQNTPEVKGEDSLADDSSSSEIGRLCNVLHGRDKESRLLSDGLHGNSSESELFCGRLFWSR